MANVLGYEFAARSLAAFLTATDAIHLFLIWHNETWLWHSVPSPRQMDKLLTLLNVDERFQAIVRCWKHHATPNQILRAFHWEVYYNNLSVLQFLVSTFHLRREDAQSGDNWAVRWAACNGHLATFEFLVATFGLQQRESHRSVLILNKWMAANGYLPMLQFLMYRHQENKSQAESFQTHLCVRHFLTDTFGSGPKESHESHDSHGVLQFLVETLGEEVAQ